MPKTDHVEVPAALRGIKGLCRVTEYPPGVYFLVEDDEVVYVGQSTNPAARIPDHAQHKKFTRVYMVPVPPSALDEVEGALIRTLKPKYNFWGRGRGAQRKRSPGNANKDETVLAAIYQRLPCSGMGELSWGGAPCSKT